eukprot:10594658-Lingulodinium_polyedra.AAC.1
MRGQTVGLDKFDRVIWSTSAFHPMTNFTDAEVLMPTVGATMLKATGPMRAQMPPKSVRIRKMFEVALAGGYQTEESCGSCFM